ncbi:MAG: FG-GAP-like repeat-containing protein [Burkholderiales bacterium]|nr:FG-GAP-like repeat-containing protein [Burkholderiales bacterium]
MDYADASVLQLPSLASDRIEAVRVQNSLGRSKALQIGIHRNIASESMGQSLPQLKWTALAEGGQVARFAVESPGARALRLGLIIEALPQNAEIRFLGNSGNGQAEMMESDRLIGQAGKNDLIWTPVTEGSRQDIEILLPRGTPIDLVRFSVVEVAHLIATPFGVLDGAKAGSQACEVDTKCVAQTTPFVQSKNAVARLLFTGTCGGGMVPATCVCTGTLLNDQDTTSQAPYLFTANHCISTQSSANSLTTLWFYEHSSCSSGVPEPGTQVAGGAALLFGNVAQDVSLLRLNAPPPEGAYFNGWDASPLVAGTPVTVIHHPAGDVKKVSTGSVTSLDSSYSHVGYLTGTTEGGSSGSGLLTFSDNQYFHRGGLFGGSASCSNTGSLSNPGNDDIFSRLDLAFPSIRNWLESRLPGAPQIVSATPGNSHVAISFSSPAWTGGATIENYTVTASPGGAIATGTGSPITVANLVNGTTYTFTVAATNSYGTGMPSAASIGVTPGSTPGAPLIGVAVATSSGVRVEFTPPVSDGGSPITAYTVTSNPGGISSTGASSPIFVSGVAVGTTYTFTVSAINATGTGPSSAPSNSVTMTYFAMLNLAKVGTGRGVIISSPAGIQCGNICSGEFPTGTTVTLSAESEVGSSFLGWTGCDSISANLCTVSMSSAKSIEANFESAVVSPSDFNDDGRSDIVWYRPTGSTGDTAIWLIDGVTVSAGAAIVSGSPYRVTHTGDFNGDGKADLVFRNETTGEVSLFMMNGTAVSSGAGILPPNTGYRMRHLADFNGDGKSDIIWQHSDGSVAVWQMNGGTATAGASLIGAGSGWSPKHVADFNGDGNADILWQHLDGGVALWLMQGLNVLQGGEILAAGSGYVAEHVGDLNGDGKADIVWKSSNGGYSAWLMNGLSALQGGALVGGGTGYVITHVAEFNGDGKSDLLFRGSDGTVIMWQMSGLSVLVSATLPGTSTTRRATNARDYSGDGKADILWALDDGSYQLWLMDGASTIASTTLLGPGTGFQENADVNIPANCVIKDKLLYSGWYPGNNPYLVPFHNQPANETWAFKFPISELLGTGIPNAVGSVTRYDSLVPMSMSISTSPCDFSESPSPLQCQRFGTSGLSVRYVANSHPATDSVVAGAGYCRLAPTTGLNELYINLKFAVPPNILNPAQSTCTEAGCGYFLFYERF